MKYLRSKGRKSEKDGTKDIYDEREWGYGYMHNIFLLPLSISDSIFYLSFKGQTNYLTTQQK